MSHRIFLSHNYNDKPVVEPVALRLAQIFGQDNIFYDAWSIQPGQGIIDQMNNGLSAPEFVFFFVSAKSLASGMVKLEWQNALYSASQGKTRIIPVRVDGTAMPPILMQTLYIDMHTIGLEAAIAQIVSVAQGNASFTPQHAGFSNLTYTVENLPDGSINIVVRASHLMEPNPMFGLLVENSEDEVTWGAPAAPAFTSGFNPDITLDDGVTVINMIAIRPVNQSLTPAHSMRFELKPKGSVPVRFRGVFHQVSEDQWKAIPVVPAK